MRVEVERTRKVESDARDDRANCGEEVWGKDGDEFADVISPHARPLVYFKVSPHPDVFLA